MTQTYEQRLYLMAEQYFRTYELPKYSTEQQPQALNDYRQFLGTQTTKQLEEIIRDFDVKDDMPLWRTEYMKIK